MTNLSFVFVGSPSGLMDYIKSFMPNCEICEDKGYIERTEWTGTDDSHSILGRCECSYD